MRIFGNHTSALFAIVLLCSTISYSQTSSINFLETLMQKHRVPALSIAYVQNNKIAFSGAIGIKSSESKVPIDEETIFSAASLSKPLFAYMVMQLVDAKKLDLDRPVHEYYKYKDVEEDPRHLKVTARMLLSHSAGLPNWRRGPLKFIFDPGNGFHYSGEGFVWLMKVVENITNKTIDENMLMMVYEPLGLANTSYIWKSEFQNFALPHNELGIPQKKRKPRTGNSAHSLQTTSMDFALFLKALFQKKGITTANFEEISTAQADVIQYFNGGKKDTAQVVSWGLGWGIQETRKGKAIWQWGDNGTFKSFVIAYPEHEEGIVFFTNSFNGLRLVPDIVAHFLNDECPAFDLLDYNMADSPSTALITSIQKSGYDRAITPYLTTQGIADSTQLNTRDIAMAALHFWRANKLKETNQLLELNIRTNPKNKNPHLDMAHFSLANNEMANAEKYFHQARLLDPEYFQYENLYFPWTSDLGDSSAIFSLEGHQDAQQVMLVGSFNNWDSRALPMLKTDQGWQCAIDLPSGNHQYKFVIDGEWILDPSNTKTAKSGGQTNSLFKN